MAAHINLLYKLGPKYDNEPIYCFGGRTIVRDVGNGFIFEIYDVIEDGERFSCTIYLWVIKPDFYDEYGARAIQCVEEIHLINLTSSEIDEQLDIIARKYVWERSVEIYDELKKGGETKTSQIVSVNGEIVHFNRNVGRHLKTVREKRGLTREELAKRANYWTDQIKRFENEEDRRRESYPTHMLICIADGLNMSVYEFLNEEET